MPYSHSIVQYSLLIATACTCTAHTQLYSTIVVCTHVQTAVVFSSVVRRNVHSSLLLLCHSFEFDIECICRTRGGALLYVYGVRYSQ